MEPEIVKTTVTPLKDLLPEVYGDALKPGMKAVGHAIGDALEMCLLPITAIGYIPKVAKACLEKHLHSFEEKLNKIPEEKKRIFILKYQSPLYKNYFIQLMRPLRSYSLIY